MQKSQQTVSAEYMINKVWDFMNHVRGRFPIGDMLTPILAILYAFHKGYLIHVIGNHRIEFILNDDNLYSDLANLVPNDKHLHTAMCQFIKELTCIDKNEFNSVYGEVLRGLFEMVSSDSSRGFGEFYTPSSVSKLMAYIVDKEKCNDIFDPFCGSASIIHELSQSGGLPQFAGQEINYITSIYARLNAEALFGHDGCISNVDSIRRWDNCTYDAVVSCPPLGLRLTQEQLCEARNATPECPCRSYEEIILTRPFYCNQARLTVTLLSASFCHRAHHDYELRRDLVERNLIDTIISLPTNILFSTSIPSVILVCKRGRDQEEPIKFIYAEDYYQGSRRKRTFDYKRFVEMVEGDMCDIAKVSLDDIRRYDYNLNPLLYIKPDFDLKDGQKVFPIEDLMTPIEGERISATDVNDLISYDNLDMNFIRVLLNNGKSSMPSEISQNSSYRRVKASNDKYLLVYSNLIMKLYGINTDGRGFVYSVDINVFKVNENLVTPEYLAYTLINHKAISRGRMPLSGYMKLPIVVDTIENQKEIVNKEIQQYEQKVNAEQIADAKRLGVKQHVSDLEHMLGSTQLRISKIITRLENATPSSDNYQHLVKSIKDNVEYMNRIIHYNNASIDSESFNIKDGDIATFIHNYVDAWNNYGGEYFELYVQNLLQNNIKMSFDRTLLTVMLDSILNNAIRHSFHKRKNYTEHNVVQISFSAVEYNGLPYVLLSVSNNGDPIAEGFTIGDYISRGRYTASTGRSGLGGYHVYQIAKGHKGFLYLDMNKVWNMIVEVLLPIESTILNDIPAYDKECI